ncbi:MAG TPA: hypothetical protein VFH22_13295 [Rhodocyclaceae bacterium]|nr:hypothetical protein [Rhodocyclaceae bacterium]
MRTSFLVSRLLGIALLIGLVGCSTSGQAARLVDVDIVNRSTGERLTPIRHHGKLYVAGRPGDRYGIELRNKQGGRVLTVISVDGVNVLTGQTAAPLQSGYVLDSRQTYSITGWRKNMDEVAQFLFTALPDSYAARTGRPDHVGVIGVAVFRERVDAPPVVTPFPESRFDDGRRENDGLAMRRDMASSSPAPAAPGAPAESLAAASGAAEDSSASRPAPQLSERHAAKSASEEKSRQRLGTGHGEREHAPTRSTEFARASDSPDEIVTIYYDSRANLIARGILRAPRLAEPQPFPGGFVPDPRG